jgi:hypothetical protein
VKYVPDWFPGARFKRDAIVLKELGYKALHGPFDFAKRSRVGNYYLPRCSVFDSFQASAQEGDSMVSRLLTEIETGDSQENQDELEMAAKRATSVMYTAGSDTVSSCSLTWTYMTRMSNYSQGVAALESFFLGMMLRPDAQEKAHEELQHIVRDGRLPDFSDDLPYIRAIAKECLRWNPAVPLGKQPILGLSC